PIPSSPPLGRWAARIAYGSSARVCKCAQGSFGGEVLTAVHGSLHGGETVGGTEPQGVVRSVLPAAGAAMVVVLSARRRRRCAPHRELTEAAACNRREAAAW
ncbi:MAG: hypothetical protein OXN89_05085, partial [Bryobacterales bacterium]|nr:hypothetical protein [Bryobacterales bacterium]